MGTLRNFSTRAGLLGLLMVFVFCCTKEAPKSDSTIVGERRIAGIEDILFIGNSLTSYNSGISHHLGLFCANETTLSKPLIQEVSFSGYSLAIHLINEQTLTKVNERSWDVIVLQESTMIAVDDAMATMESLKSFQKLVQQKGTRIYLLMPWPFKDRPEMLTPLQKTYKDGAQAIGATIIPVGEIWNTINQEENPSINLYDPDGIHPSLQGTFLATSMCYASIFNKKPSQNLYAAGLENNTALYLKQKAD